MYRHQSLTDAIKQLRSLKSANTSTSNNKYQNNSYQYKHGKVPNRYTNNSELASLPSPSSNHFNRSAYNTKVDTTDNLNKSTYHAKPALSSLYSPSINNPKVIKPTSNPPKENTISKSSTPSSPRFTPAPPTPSTPTPSPTTPNPPTTPSTASFKRSTSHQPVIKLLPQNNTNCHVRFDPLAMFNRQKKYSNVYYLFGLKLLNGSDVQKRAAHYIRIAADQGHLSAIKRYATMLYDGYRVGATHKPTQLTTRSSPRSAASSDKGIRRDKKEAAKYLKKAFEMGDLPSMRKLRSMLYDGDGIQKDRKTAASFYKIDADKGDVRAICQYGLMLREGEGVSRDEKEAARYFKLAVDMGDTVGMRNYAYMFQTGSGVDYSLKEAINYYRMAADKGDAESAREIVKILENGCAFLMGRKESAKYYKILADKGDADALKKYTAIVGDKK